MSDELAELLKTKELLQQLIDENEYIQMEMDKRNALPILKELHQDFKRGYKKQLEETEYKILELKTKGKT